MGLPAWLTRQLQVTDLQIAMPEGSSVRVASGFSAWYNHGVLLSGAESIIADRRLVITMVTLVVILPLCFPRELGALAWVSMAAVSYSPSPHS